jgi:xylulose-5-phosphate/fructose-6-phosphate phosphoketolase
VINVVDLMRLIRGRTSHGLTDKEFDVLFTKDKLVVFAFPGTVADPPDRRTTATCVRGYKDEGTTTTP